MKKQIVLLESRPLKSEKSLDADSAVDTDLEIENQVVHMEIQPTPK
jgi:hypothetical protein